MPINLDAGHDQPIFGPEPADLEERLAEAQEIVDRVASPSMGSVHLLRERNKARRAAERAVATMRALREAQLQLDREWAAGALQVASLEAAIQAEKEADDLLAQWKRVGASGMLGG